MVPENTIQKPKQVSLFEDLLKVFEDFSWKNTVAGGTFDCGKLKIIDVQKPHPKTSGCEFFLGRALGSGGTKQVATDDRLKPDQSVPVGYSASDFRR